MGQRFDGSGYDEFERVAMRRSCWVRQLKKERTEDAKVEFVEIKHRPS